MQHDLWLLLVASYQMLYTPCWFLRHRGFNLLDALPDRPHHQCMTSSMYNSKGKPQSALQYFADSYKGLSSMPVLSRVLSWQPSGAMLPSPILPWLLRS